MPSIRGLPSGATRKDLDDTLLNPPTPTLPSPALMGSDASPVVRPTPPPRRFQNGYVVERWFTTATDMTIPDAQVPGGPGSNASVDLVQSMDPDLLVAVLHRVSQSDSPQISGPAIFVISTQLSNEPGGAPIRNVNIELRDDVRAVQPMEGNCFEGNCACSMYVHFENGSDQHPRLVRSVSQSVRWAVCSPCPSSTSHSDWCYPVVCPMMPAAGASSAGSSS